MATAVHRIEEDAAIASPASPQVQAQWAAKPIASRLKVLRRARHLLAPLGLQLADAIPSHLARNRADSLVAEVLPLLAACKFLETEAAGILKARKLGRRGLPFWLAGLQTTIERVPCGVVLIIAPANYPLFLPAVQTLQALAAGNAVIWKPGQGGHCVAALFARAMQEACLPDGLLRVTGESVEAGKAELGLAPDKVVFTGSFDVGRAILQVAAETATSVVTELSGCDAVVALPSANADRVIDALAFGMRLNGSATCMAPRRLFLVGPKHVALPRMLQERFEAMTGVKLQEAVRLKLLHLLDDAREHGATICGDADANLCKPILVLGGRSEMALARADIFAPVLTVLQVQDEEDLIAADAACPMGLTAAVFGDESAACRVGARLKVGTVLVNDLIVPTADPRVSFGGRRNSGYGSTRGAEGLLEMTIPKVVAVRRSASRRHFAATTEAHESFFQAIIMATHASTLVARVHALRQFASAAKRVDKLDKLDS